MIRIFYFQSIIIACLIIICLTNCKQENHLYQNKISGDESSVSSGKRFNNKIDTKYTFKLQLKPRDKFLYTISNVTDIRIEYNDKKINNTNTTNISLLYQVITDTADKYAIKVTYDKLHTVIKNGDVTQEMDADNVYSFNATEKLLAGLKGQSVIITLNKKGDLLSVSGYKEIADRIVSQVQLTDENQKKQLQDQLINMLGEGFIKSNVNLEADVFTRSSLHIGDTWTKNITELTPIPANGITQYKLESIDNEIARISASTKLKGGSENTTVMGTNVSATLDGKNYTDYRLNMLSGMIIDEKTISNLAGTMHIMEKDVPVKIKIEKTVAVKKI